MIVDTLHDEYPEMIQDLYWDVTVRTRGFRFTDVNNRLWKMYESELNEQLA